jgi:hypothetical protein
MHIIKTKVNISLVCLLQKTFKVFGFTIFNQTQVAAIHFRIFCLSLDCPFWLSLLFYLTSIYKRFRWCTWTVALSYHVTRYGLCSGLPYYYMTILPGEGSPYLPPGNVWEALWLESCDPSPVQSMMVASEPGKKNHLLSYQSSVMLINTY